VRDEKKYNSSPSKEKVCKQKEVTLHESLRFDKDSRARPSQARPG